jgi:hypothetical protein
MIKYKPNNVNKINDINFATSLPVGIKLILDPNDIKNPIKIKNIPNN